MSKYRSFRKCGAECTEHWFHLSDGTPIDAENRPLDTDGKPITACIESVYDNFSSHTCGRKLKGDPEFPSLCGLHVSVIHRRRAKTAQNQQARAEGDAAREAFRARVSKSATPLGVEIRDAHYGSQTVTLSIEQFEALAARVAELEETLRMEIG